MSIRSRLLLLVLLAISLPAILVGLRFFDDREREIADAIASLSVDADDIAGALNEKILGTAQLLYGLGRARDLDTGDRAACSAFLAAVREEYPQYTGILTINPDGQLFCDSLGTGRDLDLRDRDYFQQASAQSSGVVLEPAFGRLTGISVLQIAHPVHDASGDLKFILLASLNLPKLLQDRAVRKTETAFVDTKGTVHAWQAANGNGSAAGSSIVDTPLFRFAAAHDAGGAGEIMRASGDQAVWAVSGNPAMRRAGLYVLVGQPKDILVADANQGLLEELSVLAAVALMLFLGVWFLAEISIRRQVARIGKMAERLAAGDLHARIALPHPGGELGGLMTLLNGTAESLERQRDAIEELNQKLRQSQKMEAVGQLTGGVAHDFNNLLTVILGNAELLVEQLGHQPALLGFAETVMRATERGASLTRSLLAFARRQPLEPRSVEINQLLLRMESLLHRALGEQIECRFALDQEVWPAMVDPAQLETALLNLALNGRDAMSGGGQLTVETANVHLDEVYAGQNDDVDPGDYVMVAVADSGSGMDANVLAHAFEPFFTTKDVGKGTGLGLSMVYGFIKQTGGHIKIYSELGDGTIVKLYLPRSSTAPAGMTRAVGALPRGSGETILAVEDDEMVRVHVAGELNALGYNVLTARSGAEALEVLRGNLTIDLLFSDVVMPGGMSGPQLAEQALRLRPGLRVLYTSGYTENTVIHQGRVDPGVQLLNKPYRRQDLAAKLRAVLRGS
jgi:signal transduction histidine kinase/CheY-like chemotaxis protein